MRQATVADAELINDWVWRDCGKRPDFSHFIADRMNVALIEGEGGALFVWRGPGIYEVHVFFSQRGREVIRLSHRMLDLMRERGAKLFWAAVPVEARNVVMFTRIMGWESQGVELLSHGRCELFIGK